MEDRILISGATIVNENRVFEGSVLIRDGLIEGVFHRDDPEVPVEDWENIEIIDARGLHLFPGVIDDQVHFREPGLTQKGDIYSERWFSVSQCCFNS